MTRTSISQPPVETDHAAKTCSCAEFNQHRIGQLWKRCQHLDCRPVAPKAPAVKRIGEGLYQVASDTVEGRSYTVDLKGTPTCQCPHHYHRLRGLPGRECKHIEQAKAKCAEVTAAKARAIPDVTIDWLAAKYETTKPEISAVLYAEIRRRGAEAIRNDAMLAIFS